MRSVRLRLVGLKYSAEIPEGGTATIEQTDVDATPKGLLKLTQQFPPKYECFYDLGTCALTIERPGSGPLVLIPKAEATLVGQLTQYPPRGDLFQLNAPI